MKKHILSLWVKNKHGVVSRVSSLFNRRGYNIDSFSSGQVSNGVYRMTIILSGEVHTIDLIKKQLEKLVDVIRVTEFDVEHMELQELIMVKLLRDESVMNDIQAIAARHEARVLGEDATSVTYLLTAEPVIVDRFLESLQPFGIMSVNRSGAVAI